MKDWELDRIYIWIRAASINNISGVKFFIDIKDKSLFNLIQKDNKWECALNQEIAVKYNKDEIKILEEKIKLLEGNQNVILELPRLNETEIEFIQKAKIELEEKKKNQVEYDWMEYERIIYGKPTDFGIKWMKNLEIDINELSRIGF